MNPVSRCWSLTLVAFSAVALGLMGCHERRADAPATSAANPALPYGPDAQGAAAPPPTCAAHLGHAAAESFQLGKLSATRSGSYLTLSGKEGSSHFALGVLGPINEDSGANMVALQKYLAFFKAEKVDAIVVTGDIGETAASVSRALEPLAKTQLPVLVVIGNRECVADFTEGVSKLQQAYPNVINLNEIRSVSFPRATLVSLPGHHDQAFLHCAKGCRYDQTTLNEVAQAAKEAKTPVILVSHGPPHGEGSQAIDFAPSSGGNVGNPALQRVIQLGDIPFGFFSNIKEAGARATDATGSTLIQPGTLAKSLYLNPGPAATDALTMNDGTVSHGFAAVFSLEGESGRWKLFRNTALTAAEKKQALGLEPAHEDDPPKRRVKP